jgi:crotonobetainyl-CoA:carnitine CoA-transferase CaiB-like acyl-CoA transferase
VIAARTEALSVAKDILSGVRVLDFGRYLSGPYCASLLGDLGAEVIRVERIGGGEDRFVVPLAAGEGGAGFLQTNRNKKSLTLDPTSEPGRRIVRQLVATADIVIANLPPQGLEAIGLTYEALRAVKHDIIFTTVNAFGSSGPWSHRIAFDGVAQAMSGQCYMTGQPGAPQKFYGPWVDFAAGTFAAYGTLAALMWRRQTGEGQHVEAPMLLAALVPGTTLLMEQAVARVDREPSGNQSQVAAPADMYRTKDGWIIMQVASQPLFKRWVGMIGEPGLLDDPRFRDDGARLANRALLNDRMSRWCVDRSNEEALDALGRAGLPAGPVLSPQQVLDHPQVAALEAFESVAYPGVPGTAPLLRTPVNFSQTPARIHSPPPTIGEHTDALLAELGYSPLDVERLRRERAV